MKSMLSKDGSCFAAWMRRLGFELLQSAPGKLFECNTERESRSCEPDRLVSQGSHRGFGLPRISQRLGNVRGIPTHSDH